MRAEKQVLFIGKDYQLKQNKNTNVNFNILLPASDVYIFLYFS